MSTIAENLQKLITAKTNIRNAILDMGGTCPSDHGFEEFDDDIDSIPSGSSDSSDPGTCLTFKGTASFTLETGNTSKNWDGTLEYSTDGSTWSTWNGASISSTSTEPYVLYLRGTGNTYITGSSDNRRRFQFTTTGTIDCIGRIDTLLDYQTVQNGETPTMANNCYRNMFYECTKLTSAPILPATTMSSFCYASMFYECRNLTTAPALPATTLAYYCYSGMFTGCTALVNPPGVLPAITLVDSCYGGMFNNCESLTTAPALPATTLANSCYSSMFRGCESLTTAPALPATTLAYYCYSYMFGECTSLTTAPALPATTLANYCYQSMFLNCTSLTSVPSLHATTLANSCYSGMFNNCTALKLSETQDSTYTQAYRIPTSGTGSVATSSLGGMFIKTGGTFTGTPSINTTYYLHTDNLII